MATSLSKIKNQIEKLQKQAATIESGIVARMKSEIAKHGLTVEHLFGTSPTDGPARAVAQPKVAIKAGAAKAAKFADEKGNTWGGMGKRPKWIHDALSEGQSLDDFLVVGKKSVAVKTKPAVNVAPAKKGTAAKKAVPKKQAAGKKMAPAKTTEAVAAVKRPVKTAAKKSAAKKPVKARADAGAGEPTKATAA